MKTASVLLFLCNLITAAALNVHTPVRINRRGAVAAGASLLPLIANAAAAAAADDERFIKIYQDALKKREATVAAMGFELDDSDRKELEIMLRNKYCGDATGSGGALMQCDASPPAYGGQIKDPNEKK